MKEDIKDILDDVIIRINELQSANREEMAMKCATILNINAMMAQLEVGEK